MKSKKILSGIIITIIVSFTMLCKAKAQATIFSGNWQIIEGRSNFGNVDPKAAAPKSMILNVSADSIFVDRTFEGQKVIEERFKLNAPDAETILDKNTIRMARVNFDNAKQSLVFKGTYEVNGAQFVYWRTETWKMNGQELHIERNTVMPDKVDRVKAVYVRAN